MAGEPYTGSILVALSGRVATGKTTLAAGLAEQLRATVIRTRELLQAAGSPGLDRVQLQQLGRELDESTGGRWVSVAVARWLPVSGFVVVDAVRIPAQVHALRQVAPVVHIHLAAPLPVLEARHAQTHPQDPSYSIICRDFTEARVDRLADLADLVIDTASCDVAKTRALATGAIKASGPGRTS